MGRVANREWIKEMGQGRKGQGNGFRPVVNEREWEAGTRRQACRRVPALMALVFAVALLHFVCRRNSRKSGWYSL
jgi:hypothetical protein